MEGKKMDDEREKMVAAGNSVSQYQYGTFQGVANYHPPPPPTQPLVQPVVGFPHPIGPPDSFTVDPRFIDYSYQNPRGSGYSNYSQIHQTVPGYVVYDERPMREPRLPCCGLGSGWFLFLAGFFLAGLPWYIGALIILCIHVDYREKPGYVACAIASLLVLLAVTLGVANGSLEWWIEKFIDL